MAEPRNEPRKPRRFIINVSIANDGEPKKIFVGADGYDALIERGKDVEVPESVLKVLSDAVIGVPETEGDEVRIVNRQRFPFTVVQAL